MVIMGIIGMCIVMGLWLMCLCRYGRDGYLE